MRLQTQASCSHGQTRRNHDVCQVNQVIAAVAVGSRRARARPAMQMSLRQTDPVSRTSAPFKSSLWHTVNVRAGIT